MNQKLEVEILNTKIRITICIWDEEVIQEVDLAIEVKVHRIMNKFNNKLVLVLILVIKIFKEADQDRVLNILLIIFLMINIQQDLKALILISLTDFLEINNILLREEDLQQAVEEKIVFQEWIILGLLLPNSKKDWIKFNNKLQISHM